MIQKFSSILDYPHPGLDSSVWGQDGKLLPGHKEVIFEKLNEYLIKTKLLSPETWMTRIHIVGSLTTYQYARDTDTDVHIGVDLPAFIKNEKPEMSEEEAELFLDELRKAISKDFKFLPNTHHPIEYYFLTPAGHENVEHSGVYDLVTDEWLKAPVAISSDFDIEESKPQFIADAMNIAEEIDASLGTIERDIRRVEDLQDVIKAWTPDMRKKFQEKLQSKLDSIEDEIEFLLKTKKKIVEDRKGEGFDPTSEREVKFKYLQKFGYFFIISRLRDIFDATVDAIDVTEEDVPKIKEIVECPVDVKGTLDKSALGPTFYSGGVFTGWVLNNGAFIENDSVEHEDVVKDDPELFGLKSTDIKPFFFDAAEQAMKRGAIRSAGIRDHKLWLQSYSVGNLNVAHDWILNVLSGDDRITDINVETFGEFYTATAQDFRENGVSVFRAVPISQLGLHSALKGQPGDLPPEHGGGKLLIDFDNTIAENGILPHEEVGVPMPGVKEGLDQLKADGWEIIIYSGRADDPGGADQIREFMKKYDLPYDEIFIGKPLAEHIIDDRAIMFTNWKDVVKTVEAPKVKKKAGSALFHSWLAPDGKIYPVSIHDQWIQQNSKILSKYGINVKPFQLALKKNDEAQIDQAVDQLWTDMLSSGWVRLTEDFSDFYYGIQVKDIHNIPQVLDTFFANYPPEGVFMIEDVKDHVELDDPFPSIQKAVNKALANPAQRAASFKKAQHDVEYPYTSTQFNMPKEITQKILEWSVENIPNEELYDDDTKCFGRELESHATVLFGLLTNDSSEVEALLKDESPIKIKFGKTDIFDTDPDKDAIFIKIESKDLEHLHDKLKTLKNEDQQPEYHTHCTVAYVKKGFGKKYIGKDILGGEEIELDTLKFSPKEGDAVSIELGKKNKKEASSSIIKVPRINNVDTLVYKNPTSTQIINILIKSKAKELRWYIDSNNDLYVWDSFYAEHSSILPVLGYTGDYDDQEYWDKSGIVSTEQDAKQLVESLGVKKNASHVGHNAWIDPNGKYYDIASGKMHINWIHENHRLLEKQYGYDFYKEDPPRYREYLEEGKEEGYTSKDDAVYDKMIEDGWTRVSVADYSAQFMLHVHDLTHLPQPAIAFIEKNFDPNDKKPVKIVCHNRRTEIDNPFPDVQKAINDSLRVPMAANLKMSSVDIIASFIQKKAKLYWFTPDGEVRGEFTLDPTQFGKFLSEGWVAIDDSTSPMRVMVDDLEFTPDYLDMHLSKKVPYGESVNIVDKHGNSINIRFPLKNIKRRIQRELYQPEEKAASFMPSLTQAPDNKWGPDDVVIPVDPDAASGEETWEGGTYADKPRNRSWLRQILEWFTDEAEDAKKEPQEKKAYLEHAYWIAPDGKVFEVRGAKPSYTTHDSWIEDNKNILKDYGIPISTNLSAMRAAMYDRGWIRIGDSSSVYNTGWGAVVKDIHNIPSVVDDVLVKFLENDTPVMVEDQSGRYAEVWYPWESLQSAVNDVLSKHKAASLEKDAYLAYGYWIDPNNKVYTVRSANRTTKTHMDWIAKNQTLLEDQYNIHFPEDWALLNDEEDENTDDLYEIYDQMIRNGWIRIGDSGPNSWGVNLADLHNIPARVDDVLVKFLPQGSVLTVEDQNGDYAQVTYPFFSLQSAVAEALRHPELQQAAGLKKQADVITDILSLVKSSGGATYNVSKGNLAGTDNYAVSIYPEHTVKIDRELTPHDIYTYMTSKRSLLTNPENSLGIWKSGNEYYLDVVLTIPDREKAIEMGKKHNQIAIFDLKNFQEIPTGGTGEVKQSALGSKSIWISPDGKEHEALYSHADWAFDNTDFLAENYDIHLAVPETLDNLNDAEVGRYHAEILNTLLEAGWVRIFIYGSQMSIQISDLENPPTYVESFFDNHASDFDRIVVGDYASGEDIEIERPELGFVRGIKHALRKPAQVAASLPLSKYAGLSGSAWVDPNGNVFEFPTSTTHTNWIVKNLTKLQSQYGIDGFAKDAMNILDKMLEAGWIRVNGYRDSYEATEFSIQVYDLRNAPDSLQGFIDQYHDWDANDPILMDDLMQNYAEVDATGEIQEDIDRALRHRKAAALEKTAYSQYAFWVAPNGDVYDVRNKKLGRDATHAQWVIENRSLLKTKYGIKLSDYDLDSEPYDINSLLISRGWARIGDSMGGQIGIRVNDLKQIPRAVDDVLAKFAKEGSNITIEDFDDSTMVEYPFKSIQYEVNRAMSDRQQDTPPVPSEMESPVPESVEEKPEQLELPLAAKKKKIAEEVSCPNCGRLREHADIIQDGKCDLCSDQKETHNTTWDDPRQDMEPFKPLPTTYQDSTNPDNQNSRFPWRYTVRPHGENYSNENLVNQILMDDEKDAAFQGMPLSKVARSDFAAWIDPNGKVYTVRSEGHGGSHLGWIETNIDILRKEYHYEFPRNVFVGDRLYMEMFDHLIRDGWVRVGDSLNRNIGVSIQLKDLHNIPSYIDDYLAIFYEDGMAIEVEAGGTYTNQGQAVALDNPFPTLQKAVNRALVAKLPLAANQQIKAYTEIGLWVAPDGKAYDARSGAHGLNTHSYWISKNAPMLQKTYGIVDAAKRDYFEVAAEMLQKGWARIGDTSRARGLVGVEIANIRNIPSYIDNALASFLEDGQQIIVADLSGNWTQVTYPFKSLQNAVRQALRGALRNSVVCKVAFTEKDVQDEAYDLWQQKLVQWESKISPIEQFIMANGGIAPYTPSAETRKVEEREEYRAIPVRLRGEVSYDLMIDKLKSAGLLDADAAYGDLYDIIGHLPERGRRPRLIDSIEEAKHNLEYYEQEQVASLHQNASSNVFDINGVNVYKNPTTEQATNIFNRSKAQALRYIVTRDNTLYMWDAYYFEHMEVIRALGIFSGPWQGSIHSAEVASDIAQEYEKKRTSTVAPDVVTDYIEQLQLSSTQKTAGNESNTYSDDSMEEIYDDQHAEDLPEGDTGGGNVFHDWNQSTNDFPKAPTKPKFTLDQLTRPPNGTLPSYEVSWFMGQPRGDDTN